MRTIYLITYRTGDYINSVQMEEPKELSEYLVALEKEYEKVKIIVTTIQI